MTAASPASADAGLNGHADFALSYPPGMSTPAILGGTPIRDAEAAWPIVDDATQAVLAELGRTGQWGRYLGPHGDALRERLAELHRIDDREILVRLCSGGTAAVWLALVGVRVGVGDEVILAGYDFRANLGNVRSLGALPVLVDVSADDAQLDPARIEPAISDRTRAILVSHTHGGSVRMPAVRRIADAHGLAVIEDACQNPLAVVDGRPAGLWGDAAALSFGGSKPLSAGRGGAVLTADPAIAARMQRFAERGNDVAPLSEMQAAILLPQLDALPARAALRRRGAKWLAEALAPYGLHALPTRTDEGCKPEFYKLGLWLDEAAWGHVSRHQLCQAMHAENVTLSPGFEALHRGHVKSSFRAADDLTHADDAGRRLMQLHHPVLLEGKPGWQSVVDAAAKLFAACDALA